MKKLLVFCLFSIVWLNCGSSSQYENYIQSQNRIKTIMQGMDIYVTDNGQLPDLNRGVKSIVKEFEETGIFKKDKVKPVDLWRNEFLISGSVEQETYKIISIGVDGKQGTDDDFGLSNSDTIGIIWPKDASIYAKKK